MSEYSVPSSSVIITVAVLFPRPMLGLDPAADMPSVTENSSSPSALVSEMISMAEQISAPS
jgi:hypothetical protein